MNIVMEAWTEHCLKVWDTESAEAVRFKKHMDEKVKRGLKALLESPTIRLGTRVCTCPICIGSK